MNVRFEVDRRLGWRAGESGAGRHVGVPSPGWLPLWRSDGCEALGCWLPRRRCPAGN